MYTKLICPASVRSGELPLLPHTRVNLSSHVVTILVPSGDHITERSQFGCVYVCNKLPGVNIPPDETEVEATVSADVCTLTATDPAVAAPMVKPLMVTLNAAVVKAAPDVVMISAVAEGALHVPAIAETLALPATIVGVAEDAKKAEGYVSVMVPPAGRGEKGVKLKVTGTDVLAANLLDAAMTKVTEDTCPNIAPDVTATDADVSLEV